MKGKPHPVLENDCYMFENIRNWSSYLKEKDDKSLEDEIRQNTKTGRPCGDNRFVRKVEKLLGRRLSALPWGRPRKL